MALNVISPSGDQTGAEDLNNILNSLQTNRCALLDKGDYYINDSISVNDGCTIKGVNCYLTNIHAISDKPVIAKSSDISSTGLKIENVRLISDVESSGYAIDIKGSTSSPYTGCSFSVFRNIVIKNFNSGFFANHFWDTFLDNIRVMNGVTNGIFLGGGCNNIAINMFSANNLQAGIRITSSTDDTFENTNISINNADVEYCEKGIYAYGTRHVSVRDIYSEHNTATIYSNECKGVAVDGIYSSMDTEYAVLYNDCRLRDGHFNYNSSSDVGIVNKSNDAADIRLDNINAYNASSGKVYLFKQNIRNENPKDAQSTLYTIETVPFRMRYSSDSYSGVFHAFGDDKKRQFVCATPQLVVTQNNTLTATAGDTIYLTKNGERIAVTDFASGTSFKKGNTFNFRRLVNDSKLYTYKEGDTYTVTHASSPGVDVYFALRFTNAHMGDFYLN